MHNPHFLINFQKAFNVTDSYKVSFGTKTGITPPLYHSNIAVPSFTYLENAFDLNQWGKYYLGAITPILLMQGLVITLA